MGKNRISQRQNRRIKQVEDKLDSKNSFGISDKTPMEAVNNLIEKLKGVK